MGIESNRIAGKPVVHRALHSLNFIQIFYKKPDGTWTPNKLVPGYNSVTKKIEFLEVGPMLPGRLIAYYDSNTGTTTLYVAAVPTDAQWVDFAPVQLGEYFKDSNTGKNFDPLAGFYDPLAS